MARNVAIQVLRGVKANIPSLNDGEFYFATDTGQLFVGFGGLNFKVGTGMAQVQIQDSAGNSITTTANALDVNIKSNTDTPLPVSAASLPLPANAAQETGGNLATIAGTVSASKVNVTVGNFPATQPVSATTLPLPSNAAQETGGNLATIAGAQSNLTNGTQKSQIVNGSGNVADVQAKGTQGSLLLCVQDAKDTGRTRVTFTMTKVTGITTEALVTLTIKKGDGTTTTGTNYTVTTGKTLRLQTMFLGVTNVTTAAVANVSVRLREGASGGGAVSATSDILAELEAGGQAATLQTSGQSWTVWPDGMEIAAGQQIGVSELADSTNSAVTISIVGFEY